MLYDKSVGYKARGQHDKSVHDPLVRQFRTHSLMNVTFPKDIQLLLARDLASFAIIAERFHFVWVTVAAGPFCLFASFLAFPYLGRWDYQTFHFASLLCLLISAVGIAVWIAQRLHARRVSDLVALLLLLSSAIGAVICRIYGDFYWTFSRGYFLD